MRPKYYIKLFGQMSKKKSFVLVILILIIGVIYLVFSLFNNVMPMLMALCKSRAQAVALKITNETVKTELEGITYERLMNFTYNNEGKVTSVSANAIEMNKLSSKVSYIIQDKLLKVTELEVDVPIGKVLGLSIFSGYGPKIKIKLVPTGNVTSNFKTQFVSQGINQTKLTISIEVTANVRIVAPFISDISSFTNTVTVAETVIVGDIPSTYYNIEGIEGLNKENLLDTLGN